MSLDILTIGEALVEVMRTDIDQPLHRPGPFIGPYPSGAPFIFAVQAARLGMKTAAIGSVGQDAFGDCLRDQLQADGVLTDGLHYLPDQPTGVAFVAYQADGSRNFFFSLGAGGSSIPRYAARRSVPGFALLPCHGLDSVHEQHCARSL